MKWLEFNPNYRGEGNLQCFELQMLCDHQSETVKVPAAIIPNVCN
jgi:hypothetical protein